MSATPRQADFIRTLLADRALPSAPDMSVAESLAAATRSTVDEAIPMFLAGIPDPSAGSKIIDELRGYPRVAAAADAPGGTPTAARVDPPEGIHYLRDGGTITVYKVQRAVHGSGNLYAKVLNAATEAWTYVGRGPLASLSDATLLDYETAKEFGALYGCCARCGRTLTDEGSIMLGVGPVCVKTAGWVSAIDPATLKEARRLSREAKKKAAAAA